MFTVKVMNSLSILSFAKFYYSMQQQKSSQAINSQRRATNDSPGKSSPKVDLFLATSQQW